MAIEPVSVQKLRSGYTAVDYGAVANDFVPPVGKLIPENMLLDISMSKNKYNALIHVRTGYLIPYTIMGYYDDRSPHHDMIRNDLYAAGAEMQNKGTKAVVIYCTYEAGRKNKFFYANFWYKIRPDMANPDTLRQKISWHPLIRLNPVVDRCPATMPEAESLQKPYQ